MAPQEHKVERRLAAIFAADVAGYSRLMEQDERGTLRLLTSYREVTDRLIDQHGGRIANTAGDSILAEFSSAVAAVQCALAIQERVAANNQEVAQERRVAFRIGVHVGDTMVKNGDLFGDGVNVAARLQALAEPGSICISATTYEFVRRVLPLSFEDLGPQRVKNLEDPIRAYLTRPVGEPVPKVLPAGHRENEFYLARRFQALCMAALDEIAKEVGIEAIDCPVLATIHEAPGMSTTGLAERAGIDLPTTRRSVARLRRRGLVDVVPGRERRRQHTLALTPPGVEVRLRVRGRFLAAQDRLMAPLSDREREVLKDLLARVIRANSTQDTDQ